ncbi:HAMP domain-containing protein, partial [Corynebacterium stationis]
MSRVMRGLFWLMSTSWPIYAAIVLGTNIVGAVAIMTFVVYFLPMPEIREFTTNFDNLLGLGFAFVIFAVIVGMAATILLFRPVWDWQRNPDNHDPNMVRNLVMRIPIYQAAVAALVWLIGIGITVAITSASDATLGLVVAVASILAGMVVVLITYLQAERMVRPVAATALARRFEDSTLEPPIKQRLYLSWIMSTGVPLLGIVLVFLAQVSGIFTDDANAILPAVIALTLTALGTGAMATAYSTMSVVDPIYELQDAINRVRRGERHVEVDIYDGSELGVLQAGFNEMMRGLHERQRLRDLFGRYVGDEVAQRAMDERPE